MTRRSQPHVHIRRSDSDKLNRQSFSLPWARPHIVLHQFRAGLMRLEGSLMRPDERRGLILVYKDKSRPTLQLHFTWIDRKTKITELDLIISQKFTLVNSLPQCKTSSIFSVKTGRETLFFWMQEPTNHLQHLIKLDFFIGSRQCNESCLKLSSELNKDFHEYHPLTSGEDLEIEAPFTSSTLSLPSMLSHEHAHLEDGEKSYIHPAYVKFQNPTLEQPKRRRRRRETLVFPPTTSEDEIWDAFVKAEEVNSPQDTQRQPQDENPPTELQREDSTPEPTPTREKIDVPLRKHCFLKLVHSIRNNNNNNSDCHDTNLTTDGSAIERAACGLEMKIYLRSRGFRTLYKSNIISMTREIDGKTHSGQPFRGVSGCSCPRFISSNCQCMCHAQ
eukprot:TRINITY_DN12646_c0_g1_i1.p1 TRINITY_DN12646_c0_g1~~TRINITY_DN12646_c0_g1_i1.p1  ORF type:complete len:389 (+),score=84.80 TRINITY_DN12646_c0_g1_i1:55-1221(+)